MPRIPIIPPPEDGEGGDRTGGGPDALAPEEAAALRALQARTARIDRELAFSQSWLASVERLGEAEAAPEGPPPGFTRSFLEEADRERADLLKTLPPGRRSDLEQDLLDLRGELAGRAADVEASGLALRRRVGLHRTLEGYSAGVARDPGLYDRAAARMEALVADLGLPEDRHEATRLHVKDALGNAAVDGLMGEPGRAARVLSAGLYDDALTEVSKAARLKEAEGLVARNRLLTRERTLSELTAQAREGAASEDVIAAAETGGRLTAAEANQLRLRNAEGAQAAALREARIHRVASAFEPLDPASPEDRAAVSNYWDRVSEAYASDDAAAQQKAELAFVERIGVLPEALSRKYQGALLSDDASVVVQGAAAIDAVANLDPALLDGMSEDRVRRAQIVARYAEFGLPPERAIELAEKDIETGVGEPGETAPFEPKKGTSAGEPVESDTDAGFAPGDDVTATSEGTSDQTDGPFDGIVAADEAQFATPDTDTDTEPTDAPLRDNPTWPEIAGLSAVLEQDGEEAFVAAAKQAGLNPEVARLFIDLLSAKPDEQERLFRQIDKLYGQGYGLFLKSLVSSRILQTENSEDREALLEPYLWQLLQDAPLDLGITAVLGGGIFGPPARTPGGGRKPPGTRSPRQPGPARRGDFAAGPDGQRSWNEMQQRIRDGLPRGFKTSTEVKAVAAAFEKQMIVAGNPYARLAIRGSAVTNRAFDSETGKYTGHPFDRGKTISDFDFAIVDGVLFNKAIKANVPISPAGTRTKELRVGDLERLGLKTVDESVRKLVGTRPYSFVIYGSEKAIVDRGPVMWLSGERK